MCIGSPIVSSIQVLFGYFATFGGSGDNYFGSPTYVGLDPADGVLAEHGVS